MRGESSEETDCGWLWVDQDDKPGRPSLLLAASWPSVISPQFIIEGPSRLELRCQVLSGVVGSCAGRRTRRRRLSLDFCCCCCIFHAECGPLRQSARLWEIKPYTTLIGQVPVRLSDQILEPYRLPTTRSTRSGGLPVQTRAMATVLSAFPISYTR